MIYLIWLLLNIGLAIALFILIYKGARQIREKVGRAASICFIIIFMFLARIYSNMMRKEMKESEKAREVVFVSTDSLPQMPVSTAEADLEKSWAKKYLIRVTYGKEEISQKRFVISAKADESGIMMGTDLELMDMVINPTAVNGKFQYQVEGFISWNLLGFTFYLQNKSWTGEIILK